MCKLFKIKYYTVLFMYTFALQPTIGAKKKMNLPLKILKLNVAYNLLV